MRASTMMGKQSISDQRIIGCLKTDYGIDIVALTLLPLGADANASVYKAQTEDRSYFVKLKRGHNHDAGIAIAALLYDAGVEQIISPVKTVDGQSTQRIEDFTLIVYPFIEGQDGFSRELTNDQWVTLGKALRQVHEIDVPAPLQKQIRRETFSPKWRQAVRSLYPQIKVGLFGDELGQQLPAIQRLVDRAEELAQQLQGQSLQFVLCHSDIHGGNVLLDKNQTLYIVDWDEPIMAPKERDLMFIGGGVGNVWNQPHEEELFYSGYGKTEVNATILAYYRHERIVQDIAEYGQELLSTTPAAENKVVIYRHLTAMFEPNGVVDIAYQTVA